MSYFHNLRRSIEIAEPPRDYGTLFTVASTPWYNKGGSYKHLGLFSKSKIPGGMSILRESPTSYVPLGNSPQDISYICNQNNIGDPKENFVFNGTTVRHLSNKENADYLLDKVMFFRQGWPVIHDLLKPFPNGAYLQIVVSLIHRDPVSAICFSGKGEKVGNGKGGLFYHVRPSGIPPVSFVQFQACIRALADMKTLKSSVLHFIKFENFVKLYDCVVANAKPCLTLVSDNAFALGLYTTIARLNHSCDPNCIILGSPVGMYLIALRDIEKGEELTISYVDTYIQEYLAPGHMSTELFNTAGFFCVCETCKNPNSAIRQAQEAFKSRTTDALKRSENFAELQKLILDLPERSDESNSAEVVRICNTLMERFSDIVVYEPQIGFMVSKYYVKLLKPGTSPTINMQFLDWVEIYSRSVEHVKDKRSHYRINAIYYETMFYFLYMRGLLQAYEDIDIAKEETEKERVKLQKTLRDVTHNFQDAYVRLRMKCRATIGTHLFIMFEFAMFSNLDAFLFELEESIVKIEQLKATRAMALLEDLRNGVHDNMTSEESVQAMKKAVMTPTMPVAN